MKLLVCATLSTNMANKSAPLFSANSLQQFLSGLSKQYTTLNIGKYKLLLFNCQDRTEYFEYLNRMQHCFPKMLVIGVLEGEISFSEAKNFVYGQCSILDFTILPSYLEKILNLLSVSRFCR